MSRVLLIRPGLGSYYRGVGVGLAVTTSPPLNLAMLAAALERGGHEVRVWDLEPAARPGLRQELRRFEPHIAGLTFRTPQWREACRLAGMIREVLPEALVAAGGPHASSLPRSTVTDGPFQLAVRGEGEGPIVALADGEAREQIAGLTWADGESGPPEASSDLDSLPLPAWHHFPLRAYRRRSLVAPHTPTADLESSRGCLARCVYCTKAVFGRSFRPYSAERFVAGVQQAARHGFRSFNLVDDSFTTQPRRAAAICEALLSRGIRLPWTCTNGLRVTGVDEAFFRLAKRAGCRLVAFGLETGSDHLLRSIGKGTSTQAARRAVAAAHAAGITTLGFFMLGLPGETRQTLAATIEFATSLELDWAKFSLTMPLPGTPLWEIWRPQLKRDFDPDLSIHRPAREWFEHPDLPWPVLERARRRAYLDFYGRPRWAARRALRAIAAARP